MTTLRWYRRLVRGLSAVEIVAGILHRIYRFRGLIPDSPSNVGCHQRLEQLGDA